MNNDYDVFELYTVDEFISDLQKHGKKVGYGAFIVGFLGEKIIAEQDIEWIQNNRENHKFIKWFTGEKMT